MHYELPTFGIRATENLISALISILHQNCLVNVSFSGYKIQSYSMLDRNIRFMISQLLLKKIIIPILADTTNDGSLLLPL